MLELLKEFLGIEGTDKDKLLKSIITDATARLTLLLRGNEPPEEMEYIIKEVAIVRYNRIGSEGLKIHSVEGESQTYKANDFAPYMAEIDAYLQSLEGSKHGKVRFI